MILLDLEDSRKKSTIAKRTIFLEPFRGNFDIALIYLIYLELKNKNYFKLIIKKVFSKNIFRT